MANSVAVVDDDEMHARRLRGPTTRQVFRIWKVVFVVCCLLLAGCCIQIDDTFHQIRTLGGAKLRTRERERYCVLGAAEIITFGFITRL